MSAGIGTTESFYTHAHMGTQRETQIACAPGGGGPATRVAKNKKEVTDHESHEEVCFGVSNNTITRHAASYTTNARFVAFLGTFARCAETEPEPSSRTAGRCVEHSRTWTKGQLRFIAVGNQLHQLSFYLSHTYRDPTIPTTQYGGLCHVTLYHTYPLRSNHQASRTFSGDKKTGDSSRTNPPLACNTQQYAGQMTVIQNTKMHLGAITTPSGCPQYPESPS